MMKRKPWPSLNFLNCIWYSGELHQLHGQRHRAAGGGGAGLGEGGTFHSIPLRVEQ